MSAATTSPEITSTVKPYLSGFASRFHALCDILELKRFGRTKFLESVSHLSWSGAKACLDEDRPPKREIALNSTAVELSKLLKQRRRLNVTPKNVEDYLVTGLGPLEKYIQVDLDASSGARVLWDISQIPSSFNAQVMLLIHKIANEMKIDIFSDLEEQQFELLNRKLTIYCYQYSSIDDLDMDENLLELIRSMIVVAHAKLQ